jgi:hypothetical protein
MAWLSGSTNILPLRGQLFQSITSIRYNQQNSLSANIFNALHGNWCNPAHWQYNPAKTQ